MSNISKFKLIWDAIRDLELQLAIEFLFSADDKIDIDSFAMEHNFKAAQFLSKHGDTISDNALYAAIHKNDTEAVKFIGRHAGSYINFDLAVNSATYMNNLEVVKYLIAMGARIGEDAVYFAAKHNNFEAVKYLVEHAASIREDAVYFAAKHNNFEAIHFL